MTGPSKVEVGDVLWVFDTKEWGGVDVGDNSQFWHEATILKRSRHRGDEMASVRFHHNGRVSHGHLVSFMQATKPWKAPRVTSMGDSGIRVQVGDFLVNVSVDPSADNLLYIRVMHPTGINLVHLTTPWTTDRETELVLRRREDT